jgi:hypothetical protein
VVCLVAGLMVVLLAGCTNEPDVEMLAKELRRDGNTLLKEALVLEPANYRGEVAVRDRNAERNVACSEGRMVKRVFTGHGVGEYGSPSRLHITARTLAGTLRGFADYEEDGWQESGRRAQVSMSKQEGDLTFQIVVDDGEPVRWRVIGETRCVPAK